MTDVLNHYLLHRGPNVEAPERIAYAVEAQTDYFEGNNVADVTPETCGRYGVRRVALRALSGANWACCAPL